METTVLPRGPVTKAGLYPAGATFKGLRTGVTASKPRRKRRSNPQAQTAAQSAAYAKHAAKEAAGKARVAQAEADLAKAKALGMKLGEYDKAVKAGLI